MSRLQHRRFTITCRLLFLIAIVSILSACSGPGGHRSPSNRVIVIDPERRTEVVLTALGLVDARYKYAGSHPSNGFDCSGLVAYVFTNAAGQSLPHNTADIAELSRPVSRHQLQAGDFVFFNTLNRPFSHMGIYIGDQQFVNAPSTGGRVRIDTLKNPYFAKRFESARTLFQH